MVSIMQIDSLGKRYGLLPSEILQRGNTFDLYIMDCALTFERYHIKKAENNNHVPQEYYSQEQLLKIRDKAKK